MPPLETFLWGFLGSTAVELMQIAGFYSSQRGRLPVRYRKAGFWITRFVLALVAGAVAVAYDIHERVLALNIGAATPLIIGLMARGLRQISPDVPRPDSPPDPAERSGHGQDVARSSPDDRRPQLPR